MQIGVRTAISRVDMKRVHNLCWHEYTTLEKYKEE